jgi:hypothetical protein
VNRKFAEHYFPGQNAIGKRLGWGGGPRSKLNMEIVGIVADSLYEGVREGVHRQLFVPNWGKNSGVFYVRTQAASADTFETVRRPCASLMAGCPSMK